MIDPANIFYKNIFSNDENGFPILEDVISRKGDKVTATFFDVHNNREILVEELGDCYESKERFEKIFDRHFTELSYTISTLKEYNIPLSEALQDGSFINTRKRYLVKQFDATDDDMTILLKITVEVDSQKVNVLYTKTNGLRFKEEIGDLRTDDKDLLEIYDEFHKEFVELFQEIKRSGKSIKNSITDNSFMKVRLKKKDLKPLNELVKAQNKYLDLHCLIHKPRIQAGDIDENVFKDLKKDTEDGIAIIDWDLPLYDTLLGLIYRPKYTLETRPTFTFANVIYAFQELRRLRAANIERIKYHPDIKEYQLYHDKSLIAIKIDGEFHILDDNKFNEALVIPSNFDVGKLLTETISNDFIDERLARNEIPANRVNNLQKLIGKQLWEVLLDATLQMGNTQRVMSFQANELMKWDQENKDLFGKILNHIQTDGLLINDYKEVSEDLLAKEPLDNSLALQMYKYFRNQISLEELGLVAENAVEMLDIIKLYDYAINVLNLSSFKKLCYERNSNLLKGHILELLPLKQSHVVFTKTLHTKDLSYCLQHLDPSRKGLYAKAIATMFVEARELSKSLDHILGVRGNTASGKSTIVPDGAINVDTLKAALKKGFTILTSQVHPEAAKVFELFLNEIIKRLDLNFCLDARLIEPDYLNTSIILAAEERAIPAKIKDKEFPLEMSLLRVLTRHPYGDEPCPSPEAIIDGYVRIRKDRNIVIDLVKKSETVTSYELYIKLDDNDVLVAQKKGKKAEDFKIFNQDLYDECLRANSQAEIDEMTNQIITPAFILKAIDNKCIYEHQAIHLIPYIGWPLYKAVAEHSTGMKSESLSSMSFT